MSRWIIIALIAAMAVGCRSHRVAETDIVLTTETAINDSVSSTVVSVRSTSGTLERDVRLDSVVITRTDTVTNTVTLYKYYGVRSGTLAAGYSNESTAASASAVREEVTMTDSREKSREEAERGGGAVWPWILGLILALLAGCALVQYVAKKWL